jgi:hypothetical protein
MNNELTPLELANEWLIYNKKKLEKLEYFDTFAAPFYWGMPQKIINRLTADELDQLKADVHCWDLHRMEEETLT